MKLLGSFALFLILGFFGWSFSQDLPDTKMKRTPQSIDMGPSGTYFLASGTDGCPSQVEWSRECQGFTLSPSESPLVTGTQSFCHINQGTKTSQLPSENGSKKLLTTVREEADVIRKIQSTVYSNHDGSISLSSEDTIIYDQTGKFLWEHSQNNRGFSCLYSK